MASATSSSARHLFDDSKKRLCARVGVNVNNLGEFLMVTPNKSILL